MRPSEVVRAVARDLYVEEGLEEPDGGVAVLTAPGPSPDPLLEAARRGRESALRGDDYDNPYPPGSSEYAWYGGAFHSADLPELV